MTQDMRHLINLFEAAGDPALAAPAAPAAAVAPAAAPAAAPAPEAPAAPPNPLQTIAEIIKRMKAQSGREFSGSLIEFLNALGTLNATQLQKVVTKSMPLVTAKIAKVAGIEPPVAAPQTAPAQPAAAAAPPPVQPVANQAPTA